MWSIAFWNASWWLLLASAKNALYLSAPAPLTRPPLRELRFVLSALSSRLGTRCSSISASPFVVTRSYTYPPPCCHQAKPSTSAEGLFTEVRGRGILRSSLVEIQKPHILKKVRFWDAPVLDREYAATVTHKVGCDEHSVGTLRRGYSSTNIRAGS